MNAESILNAVKLAANISLILNFIMHLLVLGGILGIFLITSSKIKQFVFNGVLLVLAMSVAAVCFVNGNPFNLIAFAIIAIVSIIELVQRKNQVNKPKLNFNSVVSFAFILIGFVYPDFVKTNAVLLPFVSPLGAIPCPTFMVILGMLNLLIPHVNKVQFVTTTVLGFFYGVTGVFQLGVYLDIVLLVLVLYSFYNFKFIFGRKKIPTCRENRIPTSTSAAIQK